jgi:hypothetical protein
MQATLTPGRAWVQGTQAAAQGGYAVTVDADQLLTFGNGDATYPRIDAVVLRVKDDSYDGLGVTTGLVEVIQGTPAAAPAAPALPVNSEKLYEVTVPAGTSAGSGGIDWATAVANHRRYTSALGGIVPPGWATGFSGGYVGQYRDANGRLERWDGAAWGQYPAVPAWQDWTPVWTTSSGLATPSFGNATLTCRYTQIASTVHLNFAVVFGTTTNFGGGSGADNWRFTLPVPAAYLIQAIGFAELNASTDNRIVSRMRCTGSTFFELEISSGKPNATAVVSTGLTDAISPWTWASGHAIRGTATYEAAV